MLNTMLTERIPGPPPSVGPRNAHFYVNRTHSPGDDKYTDLAHAVLVARGRGLTHLIRVDDHDVRIIWLESE